MREKEDQGRNQVHTQYLQISSSSRSASKAVTTDSQATSVATGSLVVCHLLRLRFVQETGEMAQQEGVLAAQHEDPNPNPQLIHKSQKMTTCMCQCPQRCKEAETKAYLGLQERPCLKGVGGE